MRQGRSGNRGARGFQVPLPIFCGRVCACPPATVAAFFALPELLAGSHVGLLVRGHSDSATIPAQGDEANTAGR